MRPINKQKKVIVTLIFALSIPIIILSILSFIFYGNLFELIPFIVQNRNNIKLSPGIYPTLSEAINYTISGYSIIVTGIFSYALLKTSIKSYEIAESIKSLESNRDREQIRQSALIVYYELLTGFSNVKDLYVSVVLKNTLPNPKRLFFSEDWVKNISLLKDEINEHEINEIFNIYSRFLTLKSILETDNEVDSNNHYLEKLRYELKKEIKNSFASFSQNGILIDDFDSIEKLLKRDYYILLLNVKVATFNTKEIKIDSDEVGKKSLIVNGVKIYEGEFLGDNFDGVGILYTFDGLKKYQGVFSKGKFTSGLSKEYYGADENNVMYEINYKDNEKIKGFFIKPKYNSPENKYYFNGNFIGNEICTGFATIFNNKQKVIYIGNMLNGNFNGSGKYFLDSKIKYDGIFENNLIIEGQEFKNGKFYFEGEFKNGTPYCGRIENYSNSIVNEFSGILKNGIPFKGEGYIYQIDFMGRDLELMLHLESYEGEDIEDYDQDYHEYLTEMHAEYENRYARENNEEWENYIKADWEDGNYFIYKNIESNIKVL